MRLDDIITECEQIAFGASMMKQTEVYKYNMQLAKWLKELQMYRELIENRSFRVVNPMNTYEYIAVVRVDDLEVGDEDDE